jgi:hypothetical protein
MYMYVLYTSELTGPHTIGWICKKQDIWQNYKSFRMPKKIIVGIAIVLQYSKMKLPNKMS